MNLSTFFAEKDFTIQTYEVTSPITGDSHIITTDVVIDRILSTKGQERQQITGILQQLDFRNGDFRLSSCTWPPALLLSSEAFGPPLPWGGAPTGNGITDF